MTYDPNRPEGQPVYTETTETVVVRDRDNKALWWIAGLLGVVALLLLVWLLVWRAPDPAQEQLTEAEIQAELDRARLAGELGVAQQSADMARADAMRASSEAAQAIADARAAEARAAATPPVIIERPAPTPAPAPEPVVDEPTVTPPVQ